MPRLTNGGVELKPRKLLSLTYSTTYAQRYTNIHLTKPTISTYGIYFKTTSNRLLLPLLDPSTDENYRSYGHAFAVAECLLLRTPRTLLFLRRSSTLSLKTSSMSGQKVMFKKSSVISREASSLPGSFDDTHIGTLALHWYTPRLQVLLRHLYQWHHLLDLDPLPRHPLGHRHLRTIICLNEGSQPTLLPGLRPEADHQNKCLKS